MKIIVLLLSMMFMLHTSAQTLQCPGGVTLQCPVTPPAPPATTEKIIGVTVDALQGTTLVNNIVQSIAALGKPVSTRVVFDEFVSASNYKPGTDKLKTVSKIVGEILDSFAMKKYSVSSYTARTTEYINALGSNVDIWEFGNESNGEWNGTIANVAAKVNASYALLKAANKKTMLTLTLCTDQAANRWDTWSVNNIPAATRSTITYVTISYYEEDCGDLNPNLQAVFDKLGTLYPNARLLMGEVGTTDPSKKAALITHYYHDFKINHPRFDGGYYYWYYRQDMVPYVSKPLHSVLKAAIQ